MSGSGHALAGQAALEQALALSGGMLEAARRGDWAGAAALERRRRDQLERGRPYGEAARGFLALMLEHDRMLLERVRAAHQRVASELAAQGARRQALGVYLEVAGGRR